MNVDLDSGGALASATLAAHTLDAQGNGKHAGHGAHAAACANCGAVLAGPFCQHCGQRAHVHRSLLHFGEELLHGVLHFDAKAWRTLPLLVIQPGRLTRNYVEGKRTRYVSPLALFLFMVFLMFFVVSSVSHVGGGKGAAAGQGVISIDVKSARAGLAAAEAKLAAAKAAGQDSAAAEQAVEKARDTVDDAETAAAMLADGGDSIEKVAKKVSEKNINFNSGSPKIDAAARFAAANPTLTLYKLKNAASQYSFMLVPISLPFLWLMFFWKRGVTMFDHAVFTLYGLSFMALLVVVGTLTAAAGLGAVAGLLFCLAPPIHMFAQLKGAYQLRTFSALWRTLVLLFVSVMVLTLYLLLILVISLS